jgi:hypothetical protein
MIEIRRSEDDLPHNVLFGPCGHTRGLLCRRHAQQSKRLHPGFHTNGLYERTGDLARIPDA